MHQAGPAIFPIDEAKDHCHGINSVVDAFSLQPSCFTSISSEAKSMSSSRNLASWVGAEATVVTASGAIVYFFVAQGGRLSTSRPGR
jgi:hypothetical protein